MMQELDEYKEELRWKKKALAEENAKRITGLTGNLKSYEKVKDFLEKQQKLLQT